MTCREGAEHQTRCTMKPLCREGATRSFLSLALAGFALSCRSAWECGFGTFRAGAFCEMTSGWNSFPRLHLSPLEVDAGCEGLHSILRGTGSFGPKRKRQEALPDDATPQRSCCDQLRQSSGSSATSTKARELSWCLGVRSQRTAC